MINLTIFNNNLFEAGTDFFNQLGIRLNSNTSSPLKAKELLKDFYKNKDIYKAIKEVYFLGLVDDSAFGRNISLLNKDGVSLDEASDKISADYNGLMVFAVKLDDSYMPARGEIAKLTRAFNRISKNIPVVLLLKYGGLLSFATSERTKYKQEWREGEKIGKISLLKDINIDSPHTGHIKILDDLKTGPAVTDFNALYKQWQEVFNVQLLNKKFYQELANWYFWAVDEVEFPDDDEYYENRQLRNSENVIRLLTRIVFCWFMKEKGLVDDKLFDKRHIDTLLNYSDRKGSTYYKAILQNLFFATLNIPMSKRRFISQKTFHGKNKDYFDHSFFRYERFFKPDAPFLDLFKNIPFLNGGLFECQDYRDEKGSIIRIDCFSNHPKNETRLKVPDDLFFDAGRELDSLNEIYLTKGKKYSVRGLFDILNDYKFTIMENTPVEEEIALDPDLLGVVFENLLASYNPETRTTARKQTGSYYTPREIVNYMVDESLIAYLSSKVPSPPRGEGKGEGDSSHSHENGNIETGERDARLKISGMTNDTEQKLRQLLAYSEEPHKFSKIQVTSLINAIDNAKILDPACGSGAFPMGVLHKMVHILHKLDHDNKLWKQSILERTPIEIRSKTEQMLKGKTADYIRKLGLIQNCIYGVDIQPIAVEISKLRFFLSLLVDFDKDGNKENWGIEPLPNLDYKIMQGNILIEDFHGIHLSLKDNNESDGLNLFKEKDSTLHQKIENLHNKQTLYLKETEIGKKQKLKKEVDKQIISIFHYWVEKKKAPYFTELRQIEDKAIQIPDNQRRKYIETEKSKVDKKHRFNYKAIEQELEYYISGKKPRNFFPVSLFFADVFEQEGFDIVIGNPPYVRADNPAIAEQRKQIMKSGQYVTLWEKWDLMVPFFEKGLRVLTPEGCLSFIASNSITTSKYALKLQDWILENYFVKSIDYFENIKIFDAGVIPVVMIIQSGANSKKSLKKIRTDNFENVEVFEVDNSNAENLRPNIFKKSFSGLFYPDVEAQLLGDICYISYGLRPNSDERYWKGEFVAKDIISNNKSDLNSKPYVEGKNITRYRIDKIKYLEWGTERVPKKLVRPTFPALYEGDKIIRGTLTEGTFDNTGIICNHSIVVFKRFIDLQGISERSISVSISKNNIEGKGSKTKTQVSKRRMELEKISDKFSLKYILPILNSKYAMAFLNNFRRHRLENYFYPDDFRKLPIPEIPLQEQHNFIDLANQILTAKQKDPKANTTELENQIDIMVYKLYNLTYEEVIIIDPEFKMTEKEYDAFSMPGE